MAKDKPNNRKSLNDLINEGGIEKNIVKAYDENVESNFVYDETLVNTIKEYNKNISDINDLYSNVKCRFKVLVRTYLKEPEIDDNGIIIPNALPIPITTNAGIGNYALVDSPWPYSKKVLVIDAPEGSSLVKGDVCLMDKTPVAGVQGKGDNAMLTIPNGFIHPDEQNKYVTDFPTDPNDKNYGFLLVNDFDLIIKL